MSFLWVPITLIAALLQALRTADQRRLVGEIGNNGANLARYAVGAPLAIAAFFVVATLERFPEAPPGFFVSCAIAGVAQILGTALLLHAIRVGSFAVGSTLAKTEAIQAAIFSAAVLGEHLSLLSWGGVLLAFVGVLALTIGPSSAGPRNWARDPAALAGIASAACFAVSGVAIRNAALSLDEGSALLRAIATLATTNGLQVLILATPMILLRDRGLPGLFGTRPLLTVRVGLMSIVGSFGWFLAMTLAGVALVRALGQFELIFTVLLARFRFGERLGLAELGGVALVGIGIVMLLLGSRMG